MGRKFFAAMAALLFTAACGRIVVAPVKGALSESERLRLAAIYASKGEDALALSEYAGILDENKKSAPAYFGIGNIGLKKKAYKEAVMNFQKAVEIDPSNGVYHNNLGWAYMEYGDTNKAEEEIQAAFKADPERAYIYYDTLGVIKTRSKDFTAAEAAFLESMRIAPASDEAGLKEIYGHLIGLYNESWQVEKAGTIK